MFAHHRLSQLLHLTLLLLLVNNCRVEMTSESSLKMKLKRYVYDYGWLDLLRRCTSTAPTTAAVATTAAATTTTAAVTTTTAVATTTAAATTTTARPTTASPPGKPIFPFPYYLGH
ncbi:hypothetical protein CHUAL_000679 [Chamberlinius hualienensis]